jgi:hypothetical protein
MYAVAVGTAGMVMQKVLSQALSSGIPEAGDPDAADEDQVLQMVYDRTASVVSKSVVESLSRGLLG